MKRAKTEPRDPRRKGSTSIGHADVLGWIRAHGAQLVLAVVSLIVLVLMTLADRPLWAEPSFNFPTASELEVFTLNNYNPTPVIAICSFGDSVSVAVTLT